MVALQTSLRILLKSITVSYCTAISLNAKSLFFLYIFYKQFLPSFSFSITAVRQHHLLIVLIFKISLSSFTSCCCSIFLYFCNFCRYLLQMPYKEQLQYISCHLLFFCFFCIAIVIVVISKQ